MVNCWVNNTGSPGTHPFDRKIDIPNEFKDGTLSIKVGVNAICAQTIKVQLICWHYDFHEGHYTKPIWVPEKLKMDAKLYEVSESMGTGIDKNGVFIAWHLKDNK